MTFLGPFNHRKEQSQEFGWPSSYSVETVKLFMFVWVIMASSHSKKGKIDKMYFALKYSGSSI